MFLAPKCVRVLYAGFFRPGPILSQAHPSSHRCIRRSAMKSTLQVGRILIALLIVLTVASECFASASGKEHQFQGTPDGSNPSGGLISDGAGNFYGTTSGGGRNTCALSAPFCGTVFKMTRGSDGSWTGSVIYRFKGGSDGAAPSGNLIFDQAGNLYGTTVTGGNDEVCNGEGCGTVYK